MKSLSRPRMALAAMGLLLGLIWISRAFSLSVCLDPGHGGSEPGAVDAGGNRSSNSEQVGEFDVDLIARP